MGSWGRETENSGALRVLRKVARAKYPSHRIHMLKSVYAKLSQQNLKKMPVIMLGWRWEEVWDILWGHGWREVVSGLGVGAKYHMSKL